MNTRVHKNLAVVLGGRQSRQVITISMKIKLAKQASSTGSFPTGSPGGGLARKFFCQVSRNGTAHELSVLGRLRRADGVQQGQGTDAWHTWVAAKMCTTPGPLASYEPNVLQAPMYHYACAC